MVPTDCFIGIDLGGTNIRAGLVCQGVLSSVVAKRINAQGSVDDVLQQLFSLVDSIFSPSVRGIGIGVPGLVENGVVHDVVNIPSWKEVPLKNRMEQRYGIPVSVNNDANCFALGEFYFGKGQGRSSMVGVAVGTGLGTGIIINGRLYAGSTGGAGEFGMMEYLDQYYEYYASGQFFQNVYGVNGEEVFRLAQAGDEKAIRMYAELGTHLGNALKAMLYAIDVDFVVLGGSVRHAFPLFAQPMWERIHTTAFKRAARRLQVQVSELENSAILGAAALCLDDRDGRGR